MKRCATREDGCTRPDGDGYVYEYWADDDGEHKGAVVARLQYKEQHDMQDGRRKRVKVVWNGVTLKMRCHLAQMPGGQQMIDTTVFTVMFADCKFGSLVTHADLGRKGAKNPDGTFMTPAELMRTIPQSISIEEGISSEGYGGDE